MSRHSRRTHLEGQDNHTHLARSGSGRQSRRVHETNLYIGAMVRVLGDRLAIQFWKTMGVRPADIIER